MKSKKDTKRKKVEILIVEDSPTQAVKLQYLLEQNNYRVSVAQNGVEALTIMKKFKPTLIISDIVMPEMDGFTLCKNVKTDKNLKDIPIILLTSLSEPEDIVKGLESGANNFVTKPYSDEFILKRIQYVLVNNDMRHNTVSEMGIELFFAGRKHFITSDRMQILDLLVSTYDGAVQKSRELDIANKELIKTQEELKELNIQLEQKVVERTQRVTQLNSLISAVRNVNQLIAKEKDRDRLLQGTCKSFSEIHGFSHAWIALIDESGKLICTAETGLGKKFQPLVKLFKRGELPVCAKKALVQPEVVLIKDDSTCNNCPLVGSKSDCGTMSIRLGHQGKVYGVLTVSLSVNAINKDEQNLLNEVAGDIAFGLYSMELEEKRKQAEEKIKESESRYRTLFESAVEGILIADIQTKKFIYANKSICEMLGYSMVELTEIGVDDIHPKEDLEQVISDFEAQARGEKKVAAYTPCKRKDGTILYADITTCMTVIDGIECNIGFFTDITERKQAERLLRENEAQLSNAMEIAKLGYWEYNVADDLFTFNDHFYAIFHTSAEEVGGYTMSSAQYAGKFVHPDDKEVVDIEILKAIETTNPHFSCQIEHRIIYADGEIGYISVRLFIVKDNKGQTIKTFGANQDITERKRSEESLKLFRSLIDQSNDIVEIIDLETGRFIDINEKGCIDLGYSREEYLSLNVFDIDPIVDQSDFKGHMEDIRKSGSFLWEGIHRRKDGSTFPVEVNMKYVQAIPHFF